MTTGKYDRAKTFGGKPDIYCNSCGRSWKPSASAYRHISNCVEYGTTCDYPQCNNARDLSRRRRLCRFHQAVADRCRKYGISIAVYFELWAACEGRCQGCQRNLVMHGSGASKDRVVHLDHDETTGKFRGMLCHSCNLGIGYLHHDADRLQRLIDYLRNTNDRSSSSSDLPDPST